MEAQARRMAASSILNGFVEFRQGPPRLVAILKTFQHPTTRKVVALHPLLSTALPSYFRRIYASPSSLEPNDKILCEDGQLPVMAGTAAGTRQLLWRRLFPFASLRPIAPEAEGGRFDGLLTRDPVETRMAYQMLWDHWDPPVDPRARRGVERIASYPDGTRVCVPWGVFHMHYFQYRLQQEGYELVRSEEVVAIRFRLLIQLFILSVLGSVALVFSALSYAFS